MGLGRAAAVGSLLLWGCASGGGFSVGDEVTLEGTVTALDPTPMYVDGDGLIILDTDDHGVLTVRVPARFGLCQASGLATFHVLGIGDRVRAVGVLTEPSVVRPCERPEHLLERLTTP